MTEKLVTFARMVHSRLKHYINGTGIVISYDQYFDTVKFQILNSRKDTTPGSICVPIEDLPKVIEQLTELQNELFAAGKFK